MELWMYLVVIGMFVVAIVGTVWITLWTIQRGERARAAPTRVSSSFGYNAAEERRERFNTTGASEGQGPMAEGRGEEDAENAPVSAAGRDREE